MSGERDRGAAPGEGPDRGGPGDPPPDGSGEPVTPAASGDWFSRLILWLAAVVVGVVLVVIAAAYLPGWWARQVADVVAGNRTAGILGGIAVSAAFAVIPLLMLRSAARRGLGLRERLVRAGLGVLLAVPNLLTLGVVTGSGQDGPVARAVLDARGPGFRGGSLTGSVAGILLLVTGGILLAGRRRRLHELHDLRTQLRLRDAADADPGAACAREGEARPGEPREG